jgi:predicted PurR-regulated permease PerM
LQGPPGRVPARVSETRRITIAALTAGAIVAAAVAAWQLRIVLALLFLGMTIAAGMRPTVEALVRHRIPLPLAILAHFAVALALVAAAVVLVVPAAIDQIEASIGGIPPEPGNLARAARRANGVEAAALRTVIDELHKVPTGGHLVRVGLDATRRGLAILGGTVFTFAVSAYWVTERRRALDLILTAVPTAKRSSVRATWDACETRLGAYCRRVLLMLIVVSVVLSGSYWLLGVPYSLLLGPFSGAVELVPVIGPIVAGGAAILAALTVSVRLALETAAVFAGFRLLQDYVINPRLIGGRVGVPPLVVIAVAAAAGLLLGPAAVVVATPLAAVGVTVFEVVVRGRDPRTF